MLIASRPQGATIFGDGEPSSAQAAQTILSNAVALAHGAAAPVAVEERPYWSGSADPKWPYYAKFGRVAALDHNKQPLRMRDISEWNSQPPGTLFMDDETCSCTDTAFVSTPNGGGHAHGYRVVCPACRWYARVDEDRLYPIPVHGGATNHCSGAYALVQSELYAYAVMPRFESHDPTPTQWRVYNGWTGKYVSDTQGAETPNEDAAFAFPSEADAVQFVQQTQGTAVAKARTQQPPAGDLPYCGWCGKSYPLGTTECARCLAQAAGQPHEQMAKDAFDTNVRHWVYVFPCNAKGQNVGKSIGF